MQLTDVPGAPLDSARATPGAGLPGLDVGALLGGSSAALVKLIVRFASAPVPPGPTSTLAAREEQAAQANLETIARAIDAARQASGESPASTNVFWLTSAIAVEATPSFFKALLAQTNVIGAAPNA